MPLTGQDFMHPSPQRHSVPGQSAKVQAPVGRLSGHQFQTVAGYVRLFQPAVPMPIVNGAAILGHWGGGIVYHLPDDLGP